MTTALRPAAGARPDRAGRPTDEGLTTRILETGASLLHEHGFAALRIEDVARAVGCGKGAIYRRYPGKAALVAAIVESYLVLGDAPDTGSLREDLLAHALQNQQNQEGLGIGTGRGMLAMFEPEVYPVLRASVFGRRRERGAAIIARGVERGELPDDVDAGVLLDTLAGLTLYRQSVQGIHVAEGHLRSVIDALVARPPRRLPDDAQKR